MRREEEKEKKVRRLKVRGAPNFEREKARKKLRVTAVDPQRSDTIRKRVIRNGGMDYSCTAHMVAVHT
jgi:hypothetical protein